MAPRVLWLFALAGLAAAGSSSGAPAEPPLPKPAVRAPPRVDPCSAEAMSAAMRAAVAAAPPEDAAARAKAAGDAFRTKATACIGTRLSWASSAKSGPTAWARARGDAESYLFSLYAAGVLLGSKPAEAYFVRCDSTTMTQQDIDAGALVCVYGGAVLRPAEFAIDRVRVMTSGPEPPPPPATKGRS